MRGLGGRAARALYVHRRAISDTTQEIVSLEVVSLKGAGQERAKRIHLKAQAIRGRV